MIFSRNDVILSLVMNVSAPSYHLDMIEMQLYLIENKLCKVSHESL